MINQITTLRLENEKLKEEIEMLTGWISLISHNNTEIFGSLNWIIEAYENKTISNEDFFKLLPQVKKDVTKNLQTTIDTRDWLRTQFGGFTPQQNSISVLELFNLLKEEYKEALNKKDLSFEYKGDPTLEIISDKILLFFILSKITHNAIKYSNKEQTVYLEASKEQSSYVLSIIDYGSGISKESLNSIYSFDNPIYEGTAGEIGAGLSLKIVRHFVLLLNGDMKLRSIDNNGTTVTIHLPLN